MLSCSTRLASGTCAFQIERRSPGVLLVRIEGHDIGEFGDLPMRCLEAFMSQDLPVELFIDARATRGASMQVSNDWAAWLGRSGRSGRSMPTTPRAVAGSRRRWPSVPRPRRTVSRC